MSMTTSTRPTTADIAAALSRTLAQANGGLAPDRIRLFVADHDRAPAAIFDEADGHDKLLVSVRPCGHLAVTVGFATSWTTLWHPGFHPARTGSGLFVLTGCLHGRNAHAWIEDGRLMADVDTPFRSPAEQAEAVRRFAAELAGSLEGVR